MSIKSPRELAALARIGRIVGLTIAEVKRHLAPGATTAELDGLAAFLAPTADGSLTAHDEHSLVVTRGAPILLTQVA